MKNVRPYYGSARAFDELLSQSEEPVGDYVHIKHISDGAVFEMVRPAYPRMQLVVTNGDAHMVALLSAETFLVNGIYYFCGSAQIGRHAQGYKPGWWHEKCVLAFRNTHGDLGVLHATSITRVTDPKRIIAAIEASRKWL